MDYVCTYENGSHQQPTIFVFFGSKNMNVDDDDNHNNDTVQIRNHKCNPEKCEDGTPK